MTTHMDGPGKCDVSSVQMALLIIKSHLKDSQEAKVRVSFQEGDELVCSCWSLNLPSPGHKGCSDLRQCCP